MKSLQLLEKATKIKPLSEWNRELKLKKSALYSARERGSLSPAVAGALAEKLGEDVPQWIAVAVLETEKDSGALEHLKKTAEHWMQSAKA